MKYTIFILTLLALLSSFNLKAQELNCQVIVNDENVQFTDRRIFRMMEEAFANFLNNRIWTSDEFEAKEKIKCSLFISITNVPSQDKYEAKVQIQSSRPIYGVSYESLLLNFLDNSWAFDYIEAQPLEFSDVFFTSKISSLLGFYAYVIIGLDYDSYSPLGGTQYFNKALEVALYTQFLGDPGWSGRVQTSTSSFRYWLVENLLNKQLDDIRLSFYNYHRTGLDIFLDTPQKAREQIFTLLTALDHAEKIRVDNVLKRTILFTKSEELTNIFAEAPPKMKREAYDLLMMLDARNSEKYNRILQ